MSDSIIQIESLYKKFCTSLKRSMLYGTYDALRDMTGISYDSTLLRKKEFWALQDISFELKRGETLGLIGQNGCGKTTLLRLLNGIFPPDKGKITINGRIGALIAVGAGFHPHMTGSENIYLNGSILGMSKAEITRKFDEIVDFAEIGDFIDAPVATYSSGMVVRLGFAIAINCEPNILLIDEILAVGDVGFQLKCFNKLGELRKRNVTTVLVTHNLHHASTFCTKVLLISKGKQIYLGEVDKGLEIYKKSFHELKSEGEIEKVNTGTKDFLIKDVIFKPDLIDNKIQLPDEIDLEIIIVYQALMDFNNIEIDTILRAPIPMTSDFFQGNNHSFNEPINIKKGDGRLSIKINKMNLINFSLYLYIAVWSENRTNNMFWWRNIPIEFYGDSLFSGIMKYQLKYTLEQ